MYYMVLIIYYRLHHFAAKFCIVKAMVFPVVMYGCEKVKAAQSCLTLCNPMDYTVHGILQARVLKWVAFPFSRGSETQGSNPGLLPCRQILYKLSYQGSLTDVRVGP